ncbi:type III secretion system effector BopA family protein [Burkholderia alba]|uniref:type III secretion system effector BopA family protein n=1 Tax=Burkholderia alba TaxID=2683677 RepID=UPI002B055836|nr:type III secretion system effector BopA family protein [Burkholderia alba]
MINVEAFVACTRSGNRVVVAGGESGPVAAVAKLGMKDRLLAFLSHVPLLKHCGVVQRYAEQVRLENRRTLEVFVLALSKRFGAEGAKAAFEYGARRGGAPLEQRTVRHMVSIAEHFHGVGAAKPLARHVVFRTWACRGFDHPGHASITIKSQAGADAGPNVYEHVSWWPGRPVSDKLAGASKAKSIKDYRTEKRLEISDETESKLRAGKEARERILTDGYRNAGKADLARARFFPRAGQKPSGPQRWELSARKVYFPAVGFNRDKGARDQPGRFMLFGLDEAAILRDARTVKQAAETGELGYQMVSTQENCASIALRVLRAGGAERFVPYASPWIYEDPNHAHTYAQAVQARIDGLNQQRTDLASHCERLAGDASVRQTWQAFVEADPAREDDAWIGGGDVLGAARWGASRQDRIDDHVRQVERIGAYFAELSGKRPDRAGADLAGVMTRCAPAAGDDVAVLTRKARVFVETFARHLDTPPKDERSALLRLAAHAMVEQIEAFMSIAITA